MRVNRLLDRGVFFSFFFLRSQQGFEAIHILGKQRECRINRFRLSEVNARIFEGIMLQ